MYMDIKRVNANNIKASVAFLLIFSCIVNIEAQRLDLTQVSSFEEFRYDIFEISPVGAWFIYLNTGELMTSEDEGTSWQAFPIPLNEELKTIRFFSDGSPFITTETGYYTWVNNQWNQLSDFEANQIFYYRGGKIITDRVIKIYNDTLWHAQGSQIYISTNKGLSSEAVLESDSLGLVQIIEISDKHVYLLGKTYKDSLFNFSYFGDTFYEKYNRNYLIEDKVFPPHLDNSFSITTIGKLGVSKSDSIVFTTVKDLSGLDGGYLEDVFGIRTQIRTHDFKVYGNRAYFTYNGHNFGVYDIISGQLSEYEINQQGTIHIHNDKIYISDKNKILDVSDYASGQIKTIIPNLKRTYLNAKSYKLSSTGILYAYTGYNIFTYSSQDSRWTQLDLAHDKIFSFDLSPGGNLFVLSAQHLFVSEDNGVTIERKEHLSFLFRQGIKDGILSSMRVFDDNTVYLSAYVPGTLSSPFYKVSINQGDDFYSDYSMIYRYGFKHLEGNAILCSDNVLGEFIGYDFKPSWDPTHPDIVGLPFGYVLLPIDSSLIYLHPGDRSREGFSLYTEDFGKTWTKSTFGPFGALYKGSTYESSWVSSRRDYRVFLRESLIGPFTEIDFSSLGYVRSILAEPNGDTFFEHNQLLYKIGDLNYHPQKISGRVFLDMDDDCSLDIGEEIISSPWNFSLNGLNYSLTTLSTDGTFDFDVPIGDYQLEVHPPSTLWSLCDSIYDISVTAPMQEIVQDIAVSTEEQCARLEVSLSTPKIRRCRLTTYTLSVQNTGVLPSDEVNVEVTPDPFFEFQDFGANVPYEVLSNGNIRFSFGSLNVMESKQARILFKVSCQSDLGQQHCMFAEAFSDNTCDNAASTLYTEYQNNVGPFDPNDMRVFNSLGYKALNFEKTDRQYYHVRFQNTGTDTAENVEVKVTLDDSLDIRTLQILDSSHDHVSSFNDGHDLILRFDNIMLPDSNANEPESNGYFRYSILPISEVVEGQQFSSRAAIYFDYNLPILTNFGIAQIGKQCGPPKVQKVDAALCIGERYDDYFRSGYYEDFFTSADGCDSIRKLNLTIHDKHNTRLDDVIICPGESYNQITNDTIVVDSLLNYFGCDSIVKQVFYQPDWSSDRQQILLGCVGDTLMGYYESGIYSDTIRSRNSCYVNVIDVTITELEHQSEYHELCYGESLDTISQSGTYIDTIKSYNLCDSLIIEREVLILDQILSSINSEGCQGDIIEGYDESGTYTDILTSTLGCDSIRTLILNLHSVTSSNESFSICRGQNYLGYTESGIYLDTLISSKGCDSIRSLSLEVYETPIQYLNLEICSGESYEGYTETGTYTDVYTSNDGCDSTRVLDLLVRPNSIVTDTLYLCPWEMYEEEKAPGRVDEYYTNNFGCDSIMQVELILVDRLDPSCALEYDSNPKLMKNTEYLNLSPNPVLDFLTLEVIRDRQLPSKLKLINSQQQLVHTYDINNHKTSIDISNFANGLYIIVLQSGHNIYVQKIIKM